MHLLKLTNLCLMCTSLGRPMVNTHTRMHLCGISTRTELNFTSAILNVYIQKDMPSVNVQNMKKETT